METFSKILTKIKILVIFYKNRDFSKILTKIETFVNIHENQDFRNFGQNWDFTTILT